MTLTIDNLGGLGAVDYSAALDRSEPFTIERTLNAPSLLKGMLCLAGTSLKVPVRQARLVVTAQSGTVLFTGYLTTEPVQIYAGVASEGPVYRLALSAVSDEWLLDKQAWGSTNGVALVSNASSILEALLTRLDPGRLDTTTLGGGRNVGVYTPQANAAFSGHAGNAANTTYGAYRALNGALTLTPAGEVIHTFSDGDGTLSIAGLRTSSVRELANDITVSGTMEPAAYWTELFTGDGTTSEFFLLGEPDAPGAGHARLIDDDFNAGAFDHATWRIADPGSHLALSGAVNGTGLTLSGGNGSDGQTTLTAFDPLELGGTIVFELASVSLNAGSAGVLGGLYQGTTQQANCFAGFSVTQSAGSTVLQPIVNGLLTGTPFTIATGSLYTLRLHLHCPELLRIQQSYYAMVNGTVAQFGDGVATAPVALVFEVRNLGDSSNTPVTVLYDGAVASAPVQANVVAVNSLELFGAIGSVSLERTGTAWITSTDPITGTVSTRLAGKVSQGLDCTVVSSPTGHVTFAAGRVPAAGERFRVVYRGRRRAVARLADPASIATEAAGGAVGTARWLGKVTQPVARCTQDCENAAQAILSFATNRAAAVTGTCTTVNPASLPGALPDIWPGDLLALTTHGASTNVVVRKVTLEEAGAAPETLTYRIAFANDWAEAVGIKLSEAIASDALLPETALNLAPGSPAPVLANLLQLTILGTTGSGSSLALQLDAGTDPPAGGGFEVRRHDGGFGSGASATGAGDLVLRSPVRGFSIPLAGSPETFFVRMVDASTPPRYSRESAAIVSQIPLT